MPRTKSAAADGSAGRYDTLTMRGSSEGMRFGEVDGNLLSRAVDSILSVGDAVLLARTSDGGAVVIRPIHDGLSNPIYCAHAIELEEVLSALIEL